MEARNAAVTEAAQRQVAELQRLGWYHSIQLPDGSVIAGHQDLHRLHWRLAQFPIPTDLTGKRVLDIGAWDGWFSFELERRGAQVVAVDQTASKRFLLARELLNSSVEYIIEDVYHLTPERIGRFDVVLFLGVLYHLKHPLLALERVCELSTDLACVESYVTDAQEPGAMPLMEFYETTELRGQFDNWVGPNVACLLAMCRTAGFARVEVGAVVESRCHVACYRNWTAAQSTGVAPAVMEVENSATRTPHFAGDRDEYLSLWFKHDHQVLRPEDLAVQVGPYGSRAVLLQKTGEAGWHIDCKLPPGLSPGTHDVRLRAAGTKWSDPVRIQVGVVESVRVDVGDLTPLDIIGITDGISWENDVIRLREQSWISLWVVGLAPNARREDVRVVLGSKALEVDFVSTVHKDGWRQVNARLPEGLAAGWTEVYVGHAGALSPAKRVLLTTS
jgi:tRNA (mo5U34)-methyltransferase